MQYMVQTRQLSKKFGDYIAVDKLNISLSEGEIFALLGPNGAGKSTAIKMLTTLLAPTSGDAFIAGISIVKHSFNVRSLIGYVPQMLSADGTLTGYENLSLFARLYDIPSHEARLRVKQSIEFMNLEEFAHHPVKTYSGGMIRKLEIAQAILHRPKVLFLDEPATGLDPIGVKTVWEHILELKKQFNTTILLTTHIMDEADKLSDRVAFLSRGTLVATGTPEEMKRSLKKENVTMEDVFIHYTKESLDTDRTFNDVVTGRKTTSRLG